MTITDFGVAIVNGDSHLSKWVLEKRRLDVDGSAYELADRYIKEGDVVVDGGACIGDHTTVYLDKVGYKGTVHAFEPNPAAFECLTHNCPYASLYNMALGREGSRGKIHMGSNGDAPDHSNIGAAQVRFEDRGQVQIFPLDQMHLWEPSNKVSFIKLDIEGMELDALLGARKTLEVCRPVVMVEINPRLIRERGADPDGVFRFMKYMDYRFELRDPRYGLNEEHTDVVFLPN